MISHEDRDSSGENYRFSFPGCSTRAKVRLNLDYSILNLSVIFCVPVVETAIESSFLNLASDCFDVSSCPVYTNFTSPSSSTMTLSPSAKKDNQCPTVIIVVGDQTMRRW